MFSGFDLRKPAQITFTLDYHELVTGDLKANVDCRISYDPLRIVPKDGTYVHGDPNRSIVAHVKFQENGPIESKELWSPSGIISDPHLDVTGQGSMLIQEFFIPSDAEEFIIGFSYLDPNKGETRYDNDYGACFHFRWPYHDAWVRKAHVVDDPASATSRFELEVGAIPSVTEVWVNWRLVNSEARLKEVVPLIDTQQIDGGAKIWTFQESVPKGAIVRFKLYYYVNGRRYKNDNASKYFLAPQPELIRVPPPPKAPIKI